MKVSLVVVQGKPEGMEIPVKGSRFLVGRDKNCQLRPNSDLVSKRHCQIEISGATVTVEDLGSTNGTIVNGKRLEASARVGHGDLVKVGPLVFAVKIVHEQAAVATAPTGEGDDSIMEWLVGDMSGPDGSAKPVGSASTIMDVPVGTLSAEADTVHDGTSAPDPTKAPDSKTPQKKEKPDSSVAATNILARYLDRRRTS